MSSKLDISPEDKKRCADRLRKIRESKGYTQEQFAEQLGLSPQGYKMVERSVNNISLSLLRKLHDKFGVSSDYILYGEQEKMEALWDAVQHSEDSDKIDIMLRLILYFCYDKESKDLPEDFKLQGFLNDLLAQNRKEK